ncbi:MAG: hypothetical protein EXS05_08065 [Planctomycetaceae bacterium]|nr:hypothetical protein [Planctomycetaceae bacterium]
MFARGISIVSLLLAVGGSPCSEQRPATVAKEPGAEAQVALRAASATSKKFCAKRKSVYLVEPGSPAIIWYDYTGNEYDPTVTPYNCTATSFVSKQNFAIAFPYACPNPTCAFPDAVFNDDGETERAPATAQAQAAAELVTGGNAIEHPLPPESDEIHGRKQALDRIYTQFLRPASHGAQQMVNCELRLTQEKFADGSVFLSARGYEVTEIPADQFVVPLVFAVKKDTDPDSGWYFVGIQKIIFEVICTKPQP